MSNSIKRMSKRIEREHGEIPKIMLGIPSNRDLKKEFVARIIPLAFKIGIENLYLMQNSMINQCRDAIVKVAFEKNYDYIMWLDDDMLVPPDTVERLLAHNKDICSGLYFGRKNYKPLLFDITEELEDGETYYNLKNHTEYRQNDLMKIDGIGFGCVLTKVSALKKIWDCPEDGIGQTCFDFIGGLGEDLSFGIRCRKLGIETWVDTSIKCGHLSEFTVTEDAWLAIKGMEKG